MELDIFLIFLTGVFAWFTAVLSGGSGSLIFLPLSFLFLPAETMAPVTVIAMCFSNMFNTLRHLHNADPTKLKKSLAKVFVCAFLSVWLYSVTDALIYSVLLLLFYISHLALGVRVNRGSLPSYFVTGFFGISPLPPATDDKAASNILNLISLVTVISGYVFFGIINSNILLSGVAGGIGAVSGSLIGKRFSAAFPDRVFRTLINIVLIVCVCIIVAGQL